MTGRVWRCGPYELDLSSPIVMGVLNVTPDSFSDGGRNLDPVAATLRGRELVGQGAAIIDIGGESTRPGAAPVDPSDELARVYPVVAALTGGRNVVSVDTRNASVAAACIEAGAAIVNDICGFRDQAMVGVVAMSDAGVVVMHMKGEPHTMQEAPAYDDVVVEVRDYLAEQAEMLEHAGIARERIAIDPGIGFGKTTAHNLELIRRLPEIVDLGYPVVIGVSRKRFVGDITGVAEPERRLAGSIAAGLGALARGAAVLRVHDVAETVRAIRMVRALEEPGG